MQTGTVKRFNKIKGYGFITPDNSDKEIFVHFSAVQSEGYKELKEGQRITFVLKTGDKGEYATEVRVIEEQLDVIMCNHARHCEERFLRRSKPGFEVTIYSAV